MLVIHLGGASHATGRPADAAPHRGGETSSAALLQTGERYADTPQLREWHGLLAEYFRLPAYPHTRRMPALLDSDTETPALRHIENVSHPSTGAAWRVANQEFTDQFAVRWTGDIYAPVEGSYELATNSDDGSLLFVDGQLVVDNDGLHGMRRRSVVLHLEAGWHPVRVEFFENFGGAGCELLWKRPDIPAPFAPVPSSALRPSFGGDDHYGCCDAACCKANIVTNLKDDTRCGALACGCKDRYVGGRTSHYYGSECTIQCVHGRWDGKTGCSCEPGWFGFSCAKMSDDD